MYVYVMKRYNEQEDAADIEKDMLGCRVYICMCIYVYANIRIGMYIFVRVYIHVCVCVCICYETL